MNKTKKYVTIAAVLLCVCAAVYLNWSYNKTTDGLSDAELANAKSAEEASGNSDVAVSGYFAEARLTRQQSRDEALNLLKAAAASETASKETIDGAMNAIAAMANYSMLETQIENLLLAKNFAECVAFISSDGVTIAVPAPSEGLMAEDVAKITDTIVAETDYKPTQIRIIEVKNNEGKVTESESSPSATDNSSNNTDNSGNNNIGNNSGNNNNANNGGNTNNNSANNPNNANTNTNAELEGDETDETMTDTGEVLE